MNLHDIHSWSDLAQVIEQQFKQGWIYRGVRDSNYPLTPGIGRERVRRNAQGLFLPYDAAEEQRLLRQFKKEAVSRFEWQPQTDLEWMVLGQHHRLPTRLLDWSESLLVALFFAVEAREDYKKNPSSYAAVYGIEPPRELDNLSIDPFGQEIGTTPRLIRPPHITPRVTAQKGVLTVHPDPTENWDSPGMHCWRIEKEKIFTFKGLLDFCGIHAASLFPDSADRHTEHLKWLHKWGRLQ